MSAFCSVLMHLFSFSKGIGGNIYTITNKLDFLFFLQWGENQNACQRSAAVA